VKDMYVENIYKERTNVDLKERSCDIFVNNSCILNSKRIGLRSGVRVVSGGGLVRDDGDTSFIYMQFSNPASTLYFS
jgi:hypothetical protein